jgi:hypothetical protein
MTRRRGTTRRLLKSLDCLDGVHGGCFGGGCGCTCHAVPAPADFRDRVQAGADDKTETSEGDET